MDARKLNMDARKSIIPIIRTKLHRPRLTKDLVRRDAADAALNERGQQPLILVSAPAGYGKSIFVSQWLESRAGPVAWLSLDESDSDLRTFLCYVLAAVQTVVADACSDTMAQLEASVLAPVPTLPGASAMILKSSKSPLSSSWTTITALQIRPFTNC